MGYIQGQIIDIDDKDIVIGMLQSLSMKDYPDNIFQSFGFTIVDEVHHISSEVFCRSLFHIVTKYTLGLSATMKRKDGLTKVFKMFLGEIIYKIDREKTEQVLVKSINYKVDDEEFNEIKYDWRGNVQYSTMISKVCNFNRRTDFVVDILQNEFSQNTNQQLLVLGHQKAMLTYIYKAIEHRNFATYGYYLGGMKEKDLKLSETKNIIIATYAMAEEGFDCQELNTLIMATPKIRIEKCSGRIMRKKKNEIITTRIGSN